MGPYDDAMSVRELALILDFDGTLYVGDLPILAYARHVSAFLDEDGQTAFIDGLRGFLEGKRTGRSTVNLENAEDGFHAVELLAAAAGLTPHQVHLGYEASRADVARSAFALDVPDGLVDVLTELHEVALIRLVTNASPTGIAEVLDVLGLAAFIDDVVTEAGKPAGMPDIVCDTLRRVGSENACDRLLAVGDRWTTDLAEVHRIGGATAYIDRYGRADGQPTWRATSLAELLPNISGWARRARTRIAQAREQEQGATS